MERDGFNKLVGERCSYAEYMDQMKAGDVGSG